MASHYMRKAIQAGWDEMSRDYQNQTAISVEDVHYGPLCPGESELQILGDVRGKRILDIACGGAQNAIALANMGAEVFAIDFSRNQIAHARRLIGENSSSVELIMADAEHLAFLKSDQFDIVMSVFGWEFFTDLALCFEECARILKEEGLLIVGTVHPLTAFEWDMDDNFLMVTDYFHPPVEIWEDLQGEYDKSGMTFFHSFESMFGMLTESGFKIERIVEPYPYTPLELNETGGIKAPYGGPFWEGQYERLSKIPFSIVYKAMKVL